MSIVHIISTLNIGGAENFVVQLANEQVLGHRVHIIVLRPTDPQRNYIKKVAGAVELIQLNWQKKYGIGQLYQLNKLLKKIKPKVVHVHLHNPFYYVFAISTFNQKPRYVHTLHSSFKNWQKILGLVNKLRFLNNSILHVCLSKTIAHDIETNFPALKCTVIPNGIKSHEPSRSLEDIRTFWESFKTVPEKGLRFLAIGNISGSKNYKLLASSFKALADHCPQAMCIQIGNPTDLELTKEVKAIGAPNVFLAGPKENAADFLVGADALVISSVQEGLPMVALEAFSLGVPIITTPAGGMVDLVNKGNGLMAQDFDAVSFKETLLNFLAMPKANRNILSKNARKTFINRYEIAITAQKYKTIYALD